jgi:hypothetical protein
MPKTWVEGGVDEFEADKFLRLLEESRGSEA